MEYPFLIEGVQRGVLTVTREEGRTVFRAACSDDGRGVYRGAAAGTLGRLALGVLIPENGKLRAERSLTKEALALEGIGEVLRGEGWLSYRFPSRDEEVPEGWRPAGHVAGLFRDPVLSSAAEHLSGALIKEARGRRYLAVPWRPEMPFALTPLFCFADIRPVGKERHAVFVLDGGGRPLMEKLPEEEKRA